MNNEKLQQVLLITLKVFLISFIIYFVCTCVNELLKNIS